MLSLTPARTRGGSLTVLCLGAHADDIEIGCGGTLLQLLAAANLVHVVWVVFSSPGPREQEACAGASRFLQQAARKTVMTLKFRDGHFPYQGSEIKDCFESLKRDVPDPDLIFTHHREDRHQDHRTIAELTWNTWRNQLVLEYEIPKYDGDLGTPNFFVPLTREIGTHKIRHIREVFESQQDKPWMSQDVFEALLRLRGLECAAPQQWAEAFYCRKMVFGATNLVSATSEVAHRRSARLHVLRGI